MSAIRAERDYVIHEDFMKVTAFSISPCRNFAESVEKLSLM